MEAWGKLADICTSQGRKGRGVRVVGRLKQDRWTGSDGKNHTRVAIVAEHVEYRPDFKKTGLSSADGSDAETLAEAASAHAEYLEPNVRQNAFVVAESGESMESGELAQAAF